MHPTASTMVSFGMGALALLVVLALVFGYARVSTPARTARFAGALLAWLAITGALAFSGVLGHWSARPPPLFVMLLVALVLTVIAARGEVGARMANGLPLAALIGFQAFRLPLELVMHRAASEGTMPVQMSFSGWNFDIVSGASAIVVAWLVARGSAPRWLVVGWAVVSSALLLAIISIAIASMPALAAFGSSPDRLATFIAYFPISWLPGVLVPAALFGQILVFRRLAADVTASKGAALRPGPSRA